MNLPPANENALSQPTRRATTSLGHSDYNESAARKALVEALMQEISVAQKSGMDARMAQETLLALSVSVFVSALGPEVAATLVERLPAKIRKGSFGGGTPLSFVANHGELGYNTRSDTPPVSGAASRAPNEETNPIPSKPEFDDYDPSNRPSA